ncbi:MAG TPA: Fe-S cluster assembly protein SufD [Gemmatimonadales bacterium]|nr:Fe-S cluster assembly protein SufD [Gemmatimonadales bacterium]
MTTIPFAEELQVAPAEVEAIPAWLAERRRIARARLTSYGFPTQKNEEWRYTNISPILEANFPVAPSHTEHGVRAEHLDPYRYSSTWPLMVFVNGNFAPELSEIHALPDGVSVLDFATALREEPEFVQPHLGALASIAAQTNAFTALNTALSSDGVVIHVQQEMEAELPIHLLFVSDEAAARQAVHPRILIVAERNSKLSVVESWIGLADVPYFTNAVTEVLVGDGSTVQHVKEQRESRSAYHIGTIDAQQGRDSHFISFSFAIGGGMSRTNVHTVLAGAGCGATLNGLYMGNGKQHIDHQTRIEHAEPDCFSREVYKGILDDESHAVFNGQVYVRPVAQRTDGKQENNNMLLSPRAHVDTKPQLEIFADDVKCTHGATVGQLDETALFYMKSRGMSGEQARQLLTYAFAADVLETIELEEVKDRLEELTLARFTEE